MIAGHDKTPPPLLGRPTGSVTALGPAHRATQPAARDETPPASYAERPRRNRAVPLLLGVIALLAISAGVLWFYRSPAAPARRDAAVVAIADAAVAREAVIVVEVDAAAPPVVDAAPPPADARVVVHDAAVKRRDAGTTVTPPPVVDAAVVTGTGTLTVKHHDTFRHVFLDGSPIGDTPVLPRKIPAGRHVVELRDPESGKVVHRDSFTLGDGESHLVQEP